MNALAHYALLLATRPDTSSEGIATLRSHAKELYASLEQVDGDRKERYRDMGK
jgi:hypothetical protein